MLQSFSLNYINTVCKHLSDKLGERTQYPFMVKRRKKLLKNTAVKWTILNHDLHKVIGWFLPICITTTINFWFHVFFYSGDTCFLLYITSLAWCLTQVKVKLDSIPPFILLSWLFIFLSWIPLLSFYYVNLIAPSASISLINDSGISGMDELR